MGVGVLTVDTGDLQLIIFNLFCLFSIFSIFTLFTVFLNTSSCILTFHSNLPLSPWNLPKSRSPLQPRKLRIRASQLPQRQQAPTRTIRIPPGRPKIQRSDPILSRNSQIRESTRIPQREQLPKPEQRTRRRHRKRGTHGPTKRNSSD